VNRKLGPLTDVYLLKLEAAVRAVKEACNLCFELAVCTGHLAGGQGVLALPFIAFSAYARRQAPPRIQNISGLSQGPATESVVG
jgi:hypothetical protein